MFFEGEEGKVWKRFTSYVIVYVHCSDQNQTSNQSESGSNKWEYAVATQRHLFKAKILHILWKKTNKITSTFSQITRPPPSTFTRRRIHKLYVSSYATVWSEMGLYRKCQMLCIIEVMNLLWIYCSYWSAKLKITISYHCIRVKSVNSKLQNRYLWVCLSFFDEHQVEPRPLWWTQI